MAGRALRRCDAASGAWYDGRGGAQRKRKQEEWGCEMEMTCEGISSNKPWSAGVSSDLHVYEACDKETGAPHPKRVRQDQLTELLHPQARVPVIGITWPDR